MQSASRLEPSCRALPEPLPVLEEMVAASPLNRAASLAFALSRCSRAKPVMLIQPISECREIGRPCVHGVAALRPGSPLLVVMPRSLADALWTMESALKSGALGGVLGFIETATLTQTRRLDFAARDGGTPGFLLRRSGQGLSAARRRWRIAALPSLADALDPLAPGIVRLHAELLRQRDGPPGDWVLEQSAGGFTVADGLGADGGREAARRAA